VLQVAPPSSGKTENVRLRAANSRRPRHRRHRPIHKDQLGPGWVYIRIPERSTQAKRKAARLARRGDLASHRKQARETVASLLANLPAKLPELPDDVADAIEDAALVTAWGRGAVPRNGYGRREIEGVPVVEEPMRLVQQLGTLARGVLAFGLPPEAAADIARRVALDSIPAARRAVLQVLSTGEVLSTSACANRAGLDRKVARMALERTSRHRRSGEQPRERGNRRLRRRGQLGTQRCRRRSHRRRLRGVPPNTRGGTKRGFIPPRLPQKERKSTTGGEPTLRPTPEAGPDKGPPP
jgi:hypothetical protein